MGIDHAAYRLMSTQQHALDQLVDHTRDGYLSLGATCLVGSRVPVLRHSKDKSSAFPVPLEQVVSADSGLV
jgi:hypothetical protein